MAPAPVSLGYPVRHRLLKVALALTELILTKYPKDTIDVVIFGDEATTVPLERLPYLSNGPFHPNTRAGLMMAQDTGGAIKGKIRGDYFWGMGDQAGSQAGRMKQSARFWVLLPKVEKDPQ